MYLVLFFGLEVMMLISSVDILCKVLNWEHIIVLSLFGETTFVDFSSIVSFVFFLYS